MRASVPIVVALGSNVGDSLKYLREGVTALRKIVEVERVSSPYRTAPMYVLDQPPFLNAVLTATTSFGPTSLLKHLKEIESRIGRRERSRYGPREIDLDLIAYGALAYRFVGGDKPLVVPHPKTAERRFVLAPLLEIAPGYRLVGLGQVADLIKETNRQADDVERLEHAQL